MGAFDGGETDIQGISELGVDPAGITFAGIRLHEDVSMDHGAGGGIAAAYRLLQQQAYGFITRDTMDRGYGEALQAVGCANRPDEAESGQPTLEDALR